MNKPSDNNINWDDNAFDLLGEYIAQQEAETLLAKINQDIAENKLQEAEDFFQKNDAKLIECIYRHSLVPTKQWKPILFKVWRAAASIVLVLILLSTVVLASNASLRRTFLRLMTDTRKEYTAVSLVVNEDADVEVPDNWKSNYYLTYIPENMYVSESYEDIVDYRNLDDKTRKLSFSIRSQTAELNLNTENAEIKKINIMGGEGFISVRPDLIIVYWTDGLQQFLIMTENISEVETLKIAENVRKLE